MATASSIERVEFAHRRTVKDGRTVKELVSETEIRNEQKKIKIVTIGTANDRKTASILLVGQTGAGKTTSLNALINVLIGVQFEDDFRYAVVDEMEAEKEKIQTQTEFVTGYLLYHKPGMPYECNFLIFDTPGLLDTNIKEQKRKIREQMEFFLGTNKFNYIMGNVFTLSCLTFVVKSSTNRKENYVNDFIIELETLFGKDTLSLTNIIATYCGMDDSCLELRELLRAMNVKFNRIIPIDNSFIFTQNKPHLRVFWETTVANYKKLLVDTMENSTTELHLTCAINEIRLTIRQDENNLKELFKSYIEDLLKLKRNKESHKKFLDIKEDFNGQVKTRVALPSGYHAHNCLTCKKTCFSDCYLTWGIFSTLCPSSSDKCRICSCNSSEHRTEKEKIVAKIKKLNCTDKEKRENDKAENELNRIAQENKEIEERNNKVTIKIHRLIGCILGKKEIVGNKVRLETSQMSENYLKKIKGELEENILTLGKNEHEEIVIANLIFGHE